MKIDVILNVLAIILFLGFGTGCIVAFSTLDKQKDIIIPSRYGRQTGPMEILYVNGALIMVAVMLYQKSYRFLPALVVFVLLIFLNGRMNSGISKEGVFIGTTFLDWDKIDGHKIINDDISTIQIRVYANRKQYVLRCEKDRRSQMENLFKDHGVPVKSE